MTNLEALKNVYLANGGKEEDFTATTNAEALSLITGVEAQTNAEGLDALKDVIGGGAKWLAEYKGTGEDLNFSKEEIQAVIDAVRESETSVPVLYCTAKIGQEERTVYAGGFKVETSASGATLTFAVAVLVVNVVLDSTDVQATVTVAQGSTDITSVVTFTEMKLGAVNIA